MNNNFFVYIHFDRVICHTEVVYIFELHHQIGMMFNKSVTWWNQTKNWCKYRQIQLVEDDGMETMIALYYSTINIELVELFDELVDVEPIKNVTSLNQQYGVHNSYIEVPKASLDKRSSVHEFDSYLNVGWVELCNYGGHQHRVAIHTMLLFCIITLIRVFIYRYIHWWLILMQIVNKDPIMVMVLIIKWRNSVTLISMRF